MIGKQLTEDLMSRINNQLDPNDIKNNSKDGEEITNMARDLKSSINRNKEEKQEGAEVTKPEVDKTEETIETTPGTTETDNAEDNSGESTDDKKNRVADLLKKAKSGQAGSTEEEGMKQTSNFEDDGNEYAGMTEEEIVARKQQKATEDAEKARKKAERERATAEHNKAIESSLSELTSAVGSIEVSDEQQTFQSACRAYGRHVGFLVAEGPAPKLGLSLKFQKTDDNFVPREGVTDEDIKLLKNKQSPTAEDKRDHYKFSAGLTYGYSRPKKDFGSIITLPKILNLSLPQISKGEFPVLSAEDIDASPVIMLPYPTEAFHAAVLTCFGGEIIEHERMADTKSATKSSLNTITVGFTCVRVRSEGKYTGETKYVKVCTSNGRKQLYTRENIIPYKLAETISVAELKGASGKATRDWFNNGFAKKLSAGKGTVAPFTELDETAKQIISGRIDTDSNKVVDLQNKLLSGEVVFGQGAAKGLELLHWSDCVRLEDGTFKALPVAAVLPKKVAKPKKQNAQELTYTQVYKVLGDNMKLEDLVGMGYLAAADIMKGGIEVNTITRMYTAFIASTKAKNAKAKANTSTKSNTTTRRSTLIDADTAQKLIFAQLNGTGKGLGDKVDFDTNEVKKALLNTSYAGAKH